MKTEIAATAQSVNLQPEHEPSLETRISRAVFEAELLAGAAEDLERALDGIVQHEDCPDDVRDAAAAVQAELNGICLDVFRRPSRGIGRSCLTDRMARCNFMISGAPKPATDFRCHCGADGTFGWGEELNDEIPFE
jgi:hypothetical protein